MTHDLRAYLEAMRGDTLFVHKPVPIDHVSALINQANGPIVFEQVEDYPGWRIADLLVHCRKTQARLFDCTPTEVLAELAKRMEAPSTGCNILPETPVEQVLMTGDTVDLSRLPGFQHGEEDMGRVLTAMTLCQNPKTRQQNLAWTRMTPLSATTGTFFIGSSVHMRANLAACEDIGQPMPMAFVMGLHPAYEIMAGNSALDHDTPFGELDQVGSFFGAPVDLVKCHTQPLYRPAYAEVVIEGIVHADGRRVAEGPGPSQALYYEPGVSQQPLFQATAVSYRKQPILRQVTTLTYTDHQTLIGLPHEARLYGQLRNMGLQVKDVHFLPCGGTMACVVQMIPDYDGQVLDALLNVIGSRFPNVKLAIAVDEDVDIESIEDLHWSIATRVEPDRDILILPNMRGHPIDPNSRPAKGAPGRRIAGKWAIDATMPPLARADERHAFRRAKPLHWQTAKLQDYL